MITMSSKIVSASLTFLLIALSSLAFVSCAPKPAPEPVQVVEEPPPPPPPPLEHTISVSGETLGLIARWYTGKTTNWQAIAAANPGINPNRLRLGMVIQIPRELVVQEAPLPKNFVRTASSNAQAPKPEAEEDGDAEAEIMQELRAGTTSSEAAPAEMEAPEAATGLSADEKLRRDLEAALAAETQAESDAATAAQQEASSAEGAKGAQPTEAVAPAQGQAAGAAPSADVDRERLLDELLSE